MLEVAGHTRLATSQRDPLLAAVARHLYTLMAYKNEYEVARLHLRKQLEELARAMFAAPRRIVHHLRPPRLRALGLKRKLRIGPWFKPVLVLLRGLRKLRGTWLDPFGWAKVRRVERELVDWYRELVRSALVELTPRNAGLVIELAGLPDRIRGFEEIKLESVEWARQRAAARLAELRDPTTRAIRVPQLRLSRAPEAS